MKPTEIVPGIHHLGVNITEKGYLFEGIWPIPDGTSINSYVVKGEKTAIIDLTQLMDACVSDYEAALDKLGLPIEDIDYVIVNHMEPDHSGYLRRFIEKNSKAEFFCSPKGEKVLTAFSGITDRIHTVSDGETLNLENGFEFAFFHAPNIHWPETMVTYEKKTKTLFSCDAFGSYGSLDAVCDDQISDDRILFYTKEAERYYANIVAGFSSFVSKGIKKVSGLDIKVIAPSHGIVWRSNPETIISTYNRLVSYAAGPAEKEITLIFGSMYGHTEELVTKVVEGVHSEGIKIHVHRVPQDDPGFILASVYRSTGIILGMPTYEYRMFPPMAALLDIFGRKKIHGKSVFRFGSFGWSGGAEKELETLSSSLKWNFLPSVEWQGKADAETLTTGYERSRELARLIKETAL